MKKSACLSKRVTVGIGGYHVSTDGGFDGSEAMLWECDLWDYICGEYGVTDLAGMADMVLELDLTLEKDAERVPLLTLKNDGREALYNRRTPVSVGQWYAVYDKHGNFRVNLPLCYEGLIQTVGSIEAETIYVYGPKEYVPAKEEDNE